MSINRRKLFGISAAAAVAGAAAVPAVAAAQVTSARIKTKDSTELYVKDWGAGRPVIFTHAWPLSADSWENQALALVEAGYRVIAYDRRGFGRSSQPSGGYDFDTFADDLAAVLKATGVRDGTLVGHSMGGGEIVRYFSRHGGKNIVKAGLVASIVPGIVKTRNNPNGVDGTFFDGMKGALRKDRASFLAGLLKDVFYDVSIVGSRPVSREVLDWSFQMAMQGGLRGVIGCIDAFGNADFQPELSMVNVPTLILHGTADKPTPFELTARRAAAGIAQSQLIEYQGAAHGLPVTEGDRVTRDLLDFLAS